MSAENYRPPRAEVDNPGYLTCPRCAQPAFSRKERRKVTPVRILPCQSCGALLSIRWSDALLATLPLLALTVLWVVEFAFWLDDVELFGLPANVFGQGAVNGIGLAIQIAIARRLPLIEKERGRPTGEWPPL